MEQAHQITELSRNHSVFKELLSGIPKELCQWRWQYDRWNLLEIVCHLYDEEREDFRARTKSVLENPLSALTMFNPELWVTEREYAAQNYDQMLTRFLIERKASISWLKSLSNPKWNNTFDHPKMAPLTASFFLSNWVAHDYLHIRQILNLKHQYIRQTTGNRLDYAGKW